MDQTRIQRGAEDFYVDTWLVQPSLGLISRPPKSTHVEPKTIQVLVRLASTAGEVVSKDDLLKAVWSDVFVTENVLTQAVSQLRRAFEGQEVIQTIPRRGYRLTATVKRASQRPFSVAVLPFTNLSGDPEQEYFADGVTETLIAALAQIAGLRLISRTSVMQYKATTKLLPQIAAELKVDRVIEGSVIRVADRLRTTVQLIDAATDEHIWARNYDVELRDLLQVHDEIARAVAREIRVTLSPDEQVRLARARSVNSAALEQYLRGRYCYFRVTQESTRMSIDYMRQAIALDPEYALAYTGLSASAVLLTSPAVSELSPAQAMKIVCPAVERALELDPSLAEAHGMLGWLQLYFEWNWTGAEETFKRAISLNPSYVDGYGGLAWVYVALNRPEDVVACWQAACDLDPLSLFSRTMLGYAFALGGQPTKGIEELRNVIRLEPNYFYPYELLAGMLSLVDCHEEAIAAAETAVRLCHDPVPKAYLGYVLARAGRTQQARAILSDLLRLSKTQYITPSAPAALHVALGDFEAALDCLERAQEERETNLVFVRSFPAWIPLHTHPRFRQLLARMNFPG